MGRVFSDHRLCFISFFIRTELGKGVEDVLGIRWLIPRFLVPFQERQHLVCAANDWPVVTFEIFGLHLLFRKKIQIWIKR
jgi:hypothetical protein